MKEKGFPKGDVLAMTWKGLVKRKKFKHEIRRFC
jgi:hypothetical protein